VPPEVFEEVGGDRELRGVHTKGFRPRVSNLLLHHPDRSDDLARGSDQSWPAGWRQFPAIDLATDHGRKLRQDDQVSGNHVIRHPVSQLVVQPND
jgi:hypothetical protein